MAKSQKRGRGRPAASSANGMEKQTKGAAVRAYLKSHKKAKSKEVIAALKEQGVDVSPNYVSLIKSRGLARSSGRKSGGAAPEIVTRAQLKAALQLVRTCKWDFESARHYLGLIEQVHKSLA